ncbi:PH (Pleckstrin Homology) domain-containing protein [Kribbella sp. VKM Ac-2568]|nr:PH (Pleckstrin Homology) domain-containing protein [Kribbella sp. VKM Ac-2568]
MVAPLLIPGEQLVSCFKAVRDFVVFTDKRVIAGNVQGITGKKRDFTSLPIARFRRSRSKRPAASTGTPSWTCGSAVWGRFALSSRERPTFVSWVR